jgi:hypothetical protein
MPIILATWEAEIRRIKFQANCSYVKWTGGVAQAMECPLCKHKAQSSNSSPTKKERVAGGGTGMFPVHWISKENKYSSNKIQ